MPSSPIHLPDFPQIALESRGSLFEIFEIDENLTLRIQTFTEETESSAAAIDGRGRELLARTGSRACRDLHFEERTYIAVILDDDPGKDSGALRRPGHRFFFSPEEVEPFHEKETRMSQPSNSPRILIAGVGNIFQGDDAFGVEVAQRLARRPQPEGVRIVDFGIRGLDLAFAILDGYDVVILVDASPRGGQPGTLYVLEPKTPPAGPQSAEMPANETHNTDSSRVLRLVAALDMPIRRLIVVGCEPAACDGKDFAPEMSAPVRAAVEEATKLIESLVQRILRGESVAAATGPRPVQG